MPQYSQRIVEHFSEPRNMGELEGADATAFVGNPVCGDQIYLYAHVEDGRIARCTFLAYGCAASLATASILTEEVAGRSLDEVAAIDVPDVTRMVGGLQPSQQHCAVLGRDVLQQLVQSHRDAARGVPVSTPDAQ
jgi:nitrogen fixation NifU-like protein